MSQDAEGTRIATLDGAGRRRWMYPADVSGPYRRARTAVSAVLLVLFLALPWLRINGHPAVLVDVLNGKVALLGLAFWAHDAPMLLFALGGAAVGLAFVTSVWGRAWCGWACPQTVFIDQVFRRVERWIEGDAVVRRRRDAAPWSMPKFARKAAKWSLFGVFGLVLSHCFLAYFVGADTLAAMMRRSPAESPGPFLAMLLVFTAVLLDFGWFREQFCVLVCPYGRFQAVLMDERSLAVAYDSVRGEPRRGRGEPVGDCVNCLRCVQVCPTGIDIRDGLQLECIACTACIDACDRVMARLGRKPGLIRYEGRPRLLGRPLFYLATLALLAIALFWTISRRQPVEARVLRTLGAPYEEIVTSAGARALSARFSVELVNQTFEPVEISLPEASELPLRWVAAEAPWKLLPGESRRVEIFARYTMPILRSGRGIGRLDLEAKAPVGGGGLKLSQEVLLVGPLR